MNAQLTITASHASDIKGREEKRTEKKNGWIIKVNATIIKFFEKNVIEILTTVNFLYFFLYSFSFALFSIYLWWLANGQSYVNDCMQKWSFEICGCVLTRVKLLSCVYVLRNAMRSRHARIDTTAKNDEWYKSINYGINKLVITTSFLKWFLLLQCTQLWMIGESSAHK